MMTPKPVGPKGGTTGTYQSRIKQAKGQSIPKPAKIQISQEPPVLDPYAVKLERFELFSTNQCYYLVGCNKLNTTYRVLKMDRTLIERPPETSDHASRASSAAGTSTPGGAVRNTPSYLKPQNSSVSSSTHLHPAGGSLSTNSSTDGYISMGALAAQQHLPTPTPTPSHNNSNLTSQEQAALADNSHTAKPTYRPLTDFLTEDPNVYSQEEIKDMLDMIHDGNRMGSSSVASTPQSRGGRLSRGLDRQATGGTGPLSPQNSNAATAAGAGGLKPIVKAYGIVGFVRFLDCYYLTLITRRSKVGSIGGNSIYTIKNTETIPLKPAEQSVSGADDSADPSSVLLSMWNRGKRSVGLGLTNREIAELRYQGLYQVIDLTKNFFFSYTYDLTRSLQENFLAATTKPCPPPPFKEMYAWNYFLTREFEACLDSFSSYHWMLPIVHGAFSQRKVCDYGRSLNMILLGRRSRHFAGTRYLKRGVSEEGKVANDVEHEQIVHDDTNSSAGGIFCSYLQVRGSIPTFWTQESSVTMPKPPIEINRVDPTYKATQVHFEDLLKRYASPVLVLDLVKQSEKREREVRVGNEFRHAVDYINQTIDDAHKIRYCALDYSHISKHRNLDVSASLNEVSTWAVNQTGFFCSSPQWKIKGGIIEPFTEQDGMGAARLAEHLGVPVFAMEQSGVLRTNCIDCLDRTNVAQFSAGVEAIGQQLVVMGIRSKAKLDPSSNIVRVLIDMYVDNGDSIALQYGGSEAHKKVSTGSESNFTGPIGKHKELLTSIRRYYSNAFTDRLKQDAMNLFLGYYLPYAHTVPLWEQETDYYLHNIRVKAGRGTQYTMRTYQRTFGIDWNDEGLSEEVESSASTSTPLKTTRLKQIIRLQQEESTGVKRVRGRCKLQDEALSIWWKAALQSNIKQRMWMQIGRYRNDFVVPSRFERLYQPDKIGQFDRFFARHWTTPTRRSHSAQHTDGPESDSDAAALLRVVSQDFTKPSSNNFETKSAGDDISLEAFTQQKGYAPPCEPSLPSLLSYHESHRTRFDLKYLGQFDSAEEVPRTEYLNYVGGGNSGFDAQSYAPEKVEEFKSCLRDYSMSSDDVAGIHSLAQSAHIGDQILSGPYRGLPDDKSAIEVTTAIHEQFNAFESLQSGGRRLVERELQRRGFDAEGVKESVATGWKEFKASEKQYTEITKAPVDQWRRSDLTTSASLQMYASMQDESTQLTAPDQIFLTGHRPDKPVDAPNIAFDAARTPVPRTNNFIRKANRLGIPIIPQKEIPPFTPLFKVEKQRTIPPGFEQINEDLYARKDNKFMVFNGVAMETWRVTQPMTKISHAEDLLLALS